MNDNSRTKNTTKNVLSGLTNKVILLLLSFVSRKVFINYIGVEYLGINSLFANILTILSLADMGFGIAMSYSYYKPLANRDEKMLAALVQFYKKIYNIIAIIVTAVGICFIPFLKYIVNTDSQIDHLYIYYLIALSNTVISYLFVYKSNMISADQKSYLVNKIQLWVNFSKTVIQMICVIIFKNYTIYASLDVLATLVNNLVISHFADKLYPFINNKNVEPLDSLSKKSIYTNLKSVFLYKFSASIMSGTDSIIMSSIVGTAVVGMYTNYLTITSQITSFVQIVFSSFTASIGNLVIEDRDQKNYQVFRVMQMVSHVMSGVIAVCLLSLANEFIVLWLGPEFNMGELMAVAITANTYFTISLQPIWSYREATGLYNKTKYVMVVTALLNIVLSIIMGIVMGAPGIIFATVISRILTYFWYEPYLVYKLYFQHSSKEYYFDYIVSIALIVVAYRLSSYFYSMVSLSGWFAWIIHALISGLVTFLLYFARYGWTKEFKTLIEKVHYIIERQ